MKKFKKSKFKPFLQRISARNYEKKILGTSDTWSLSPSAHRLSKPANFIEDCKIFAYSGAPEIPKEDD